MSREGDAGDSKPLVHRHGENRSALGLRGIQEDPTRRREKEREREIGRERKRGADAAHLGGAILSHPRLYLYTKIDV